MSAKSSALVLFLATASAGAAPPASAPAAGYTAEVWHLNPGPKCEDKSGRAVQNTALIRSSDKDLQVFTANACKTLVEVQPVPGQAQFELQVSVNGKRRNETYAFPPSIDSPDEACSEQMFLVGDDSFYIYFKNPSASAEKLATCQAKRDARVSAKPQEIKHDPASQALAELAYDDPEKIKEDSALVWLMRELPISPRSEGGNCYVTLTDIRDAILAPIRSTYLEDSERIRFSAQEREEHFGYCAGNFLKSGVQFIKEVDSDHFLDSEVLKQIPSASRGQKAPTFSDEQMTAQIPVSCSMKSFHIRMHATPGYFEELRRSFVGSPLDGIGVLREDVFAHSLLGLQGDRAMAMGQGAIVGANMGKAETIAKFLNKHFPDTFAGTTRFVAVSGKSYNALCGNPMAQKQMAADLLALRSTGKYTGAVLSLLSVAGIERALSNMVTGAAANAAANVAADAAAQAAFETAVEQEVAKRVAELMVQQGASTATQTIAETAAEKVAEGATDAVTEVVADASSSATQELAAQTETAVTQAETAAPDAGAPAPEVETPAPDFLKGSEDVFPGAARRLLLSRAAGAGTVAVGAGLLYSVHGSMPELREPEKKEVVTQIDLALPPPHLTAPPAQQKLQGGGGGGHIANKLPPKASAPVTAAADFVLQPINSKPQLVEPTASLQNVNTENARPVGSKTGGGDTIAAGHGTLGFGGGGGNGLGSGSDLGYGDGKGGKTGGGVYRGGAGGTAATVATKVSPEYPEAARTAKFSGVVTVQVSIDENGKVTDVQAITSPGMGLNEAAVECVRKWTFKPAMVNGHAVPSVQRVDVTFRLI